MQKKRYLAGVVLALFSAPSAVLAADMARPPVYAPAPPAPFYNWTGFYLGGNGGGVWANGSLTDTLTGTSFTGNRSGAIGGGTVGYNWQFSPNFVVGVEGTFDGTSLGSSTNTVGVTVNGVPTVLQGSTSTNWVSTLAARLGIAQNNWLFYGKAGGGWVNNSASLTNITNGGSVSASNTTGGWLAGVGIEYGLTNNWTIKAEYDYLGLDHWTAASPLLPGDSLNASRQINMFTVGVNYKFLW